MDADIQEASKRFDDYYTATSSIEECQKLYTNGARYYDSDFETLLGHRFHQEIIKDAMEHMTNDENRLLLEAGVGTGLCGMTMREFGYKGKIDALDMNTEMLELARKRSVYREVFQFALLPDTKLPMDENTYDDLLCIGAFLPQHIQPECIVPMLQVVKPGGALAVTTHLMPEHTAYESQMEKVLSKLAATGQAERVCSKELFTEMEKKPEDKVTSMLYVLRKTA